MKRVIQKLVLDPLSLKIVSGELKEGERVVAAASDGQILFKTPRDLIKAAPSLKTERTETLVK